MIKSNATQSNASLLMRYSTEMKKLKKTNEESPDNMKSIDS